MSINSNPRHENKLAIFYYYLSASKIWKLRETIVIKWYDKNGPADFIHDLCKNLQASVEKLIISTHKKVSIKAYSTNKLFNTAPYLFRHAKQQNDSHLGSTIVLSKGMNIAFWQFGAIKTAFEPFFTVPHFQHAIKERRTGSCVCEKNKFDITHACMRERAHSHAHCVYVISTREESSSARRKLNVRRDIHNKFSNKMQKRGVSPFPSPLPRQRAECLFK